MLTCPDKPGIMQAMSSFLVAIHDAQVLVVPDSSADAVSR
jgi:hypothetical protein